jgi:hypothetical protein
MAVSRVSLRGPRDEPGAVRDLARGDFDASIVESEDPERQLKCRVLCYDTEVMSDLSSVLPGIVRSETRADGFGEIKIGVSSEDVMEAIRKKYGIEVIDLL